MANPNVEEVDTKESKREKKNRKKEEKKRKKGGEEGGEEAVEETLGSKIVLAIVTLLIIAIWLGIIGILIKFDVGGFGSTVLTPILKDVPYVNKILPESEIEISTEDTEYQYSSLDEAIQRIKELEIMLDEASNSSSADSDTIAELQKQIAELSVYKEEQAEFEKEKEKFYEEVVFSENAPDIEEYKAYYESIEPENAEVLYKQVVEQSASNQEAKEYADTYASMKPKEAAAIFDTMTGNLKLVADILLNMDPQSRADILGKMNADTAAKVTEIMKP